MTLDGENLLKQTNREVAKKVAFVSQSVPSTQMTVHDVVMLGRRPYMKWGFTEEDHNIVHDAMHRLDVEDMRGRFLNQLSGGEKQKVLIASAFSRKPELIVMDEPTNHLDVGYQFLILDLMKQHSQATIFTSIHDMNMAMQYCDRIIALKDGEIYCTGTPREVLTPENLKELFRVRAEILEEPGKVPYIRYLGAQL